MSMSALPDAAWLFTRGATSVRVLRSEDGDGCRLLLYGPGTEVEVHGFADSTACMKRQADIERRLAAAGFQLALPAADRRSGRGGTNHGRRRTDEPVVPGEDTDSMRVGLFWSKRGEVACG